jgi:hypothetical protein
MAYIFMKLVNFERLPSIISKDWPTYSENLVKFPSLYPTSMSPPLGLQCLLDT